LRPAEARELVRLLESITDEDIAREKERRRCDWRAHARPEQLEPPGDWRVWLFCGGRGVGKTRTMNEWLRAYAETHPGARIAIIARTATDVRNTVVDGKSGILAISPSTFMPVHEPSRMMIRWPNGAVAQTFSAEEPRGLRGPEFDAAICDELAAWPTLKEEDGEPGIPGAWTQLQYGMRRPGDRPRIVVATTPRPTRVIRELISSSDVHVTYGKTEDNAANLSPEFLASIYARYGSTRLGRQELNGEVLLDLPGAMFTREMLDRTRVHQVHRHDMVRTIVCVDPSGGSSIENDEQGIVVAALGADGHGYLIADRSCRLSPDGWGRRAVQAYVDAYADRLMWERNYGGKMCEHVIETAAKAMGIRVATREIHAAVGKHVRAEPVAALFEQGRVHVVGSMPMLEDQLCGFTTQGYEGGGSPDRADAAIHALSELMLKAAAPVFDDIPLSTPRRI
jgi:phage terminase large subunit-like protein